MTAIEPAKGLPDAAGAVPFKVAPHLLHPQSTWLQEASKKTTSCTIKQVHNSFEEDGSHVPALCRGMKLVDEVYERVSALGEGTYGTVCCY